MASDDLPYNPHRKHRYYTQDHPLTAKQRRLIRRRDRIQRANRADASFGKINWAAYDHGDLWDMIHAADPPAMGGAAHRWAELAVHADTATAEVHKTVQKLLLSWRGGSAVSAADSASKLTGWAAEASASMRDVGVGLDTYTSAVVDARNHMPEPVDYSAERHFREGYDVKLSGPDAAVLADQLLDDHLPTQREASRAKAEAVRVMDRYETASKGVHDHLPSFGDAPQVIGGSGDGPGGSGDDPSGNGTGSTDGTTASGATGGIPGGAAGIGAGAGWGGGSGGIPGVVGGVGSGGGAGGAGGPLAAAEYSGAGQGVPGGAAGTAGAAGNRGAVGGAGFFPPGGGGQHGEGEGEHRNRYSELSGLDFLDELPPAYPPVLGE